jgi:hypothetical protein
MAVEASTGITSSLSLGLVPLSGVLVVVLVLQGLPGVDTCELNPLHHPSLLVPLSPLKCQSHHPGGD